MNYLYHGSIAEKIKVLEAISILHGTDKKVVYLTDNVPYALFYIWDSEHNCYDGKYVTAFIKNGMTFYEEQFPNQIERFYKGVSGYLYCIPKTKDFYAVDDRERMYYSQHAACVNKVIYIDDVYDELLKFEKLGELKIFRFNEQTEDKQNELIDKIAYLIAKKDFFKKDEMKADFYKRFNPKAWEKAKRIKTSI